jgi:uncharacterized HhH-GPD family protein
VVSNSQDWDSFFSGDLGSAAEFTFSELERKLGISLPSSAYIHPMWWRSTENAPWQAHGWKAFPNLRRRLVRFERMRAIPIGSDQAASDETVAKVLSTEPRLILLAGVSGKKDTASSARDLYQSVLWTKRLAYVEATGRPWMVLSSEYGLIHPDTVIEPYDTNISEESPSYRRVWSDRVASELIQLCAAQGIETLEVHAGADLMLNGLVEHLNAAGLVVSWPLRGRRIGEQLSWYSLAIGAINSLSPDLISAGQRSESPGEDSHGSSGDGVAEDGGVEDDAETDESPRSVLFVASAFSAMIRALRTLGRSFARWRSLLSAEITRRTEPAGTGQSVPLTLSSQVKLAESLARFADSQNIRAGLAGISWTGNEEADALIRGNSFAFLIGVLINQGGGNVEAWDAPWVLQERIGELAPERILGEAEDLVRGIEGPPALHRSPDKMAEVILQAARSVIDQYDGDASRIWQEATSPKEVRRRLEAFTGIGPRQSSRAVEVLQRRLGVRFTGSERGILAYEAELRRVMLRSGLADFDDIEHMTMSMSALYPDDPGSLDPALFAIGSMWCHPVDPECHACAIGEHCPKIIETGGGTPQTAGTMESRSGRADDYLRSGAGLESRTPGTYSV